MLDEGDSRFPPRQLAEAIALRAYLTLWNQKHEEISAKVDGTRYANGYNVLGNTVVIGLVISITRIWDTGNDATSFPSLNKCINSGEFRAELAGSKYEKARLGALGEFSSEVCKFLKSESHYAMRVARAEGLAHNIDVARDRKKMEDPRPAKFAEVYETIDRSCHILNLAETAVLYSPTVIEAFDDDYREFEVIISDIKTIMSGKAHRIVASGLTPTLGAQSAPMGQSGSVRAGSLD